MKNLERKNFYKSEDQIIYDEFEKKFMDFYEINDETNKVFRYKKIPIFMIYHFVSKINEEIRNNIYIDIEKNEDNPAEDKIIIKKDKKKSV